MLPVLYSFRRCPYAMRARLAIRACDIAVELREVLLADMPAILLEQSPKATVPVLVLPDGRIIDESWEIVLWAIEQKDPAGLAGQDGCHRLDADILIEMNDFSFKEDLDHYKYSDRYPQHSMQHYRSEGEVFLRELEERLDENPYLLDDRITIADIGVFPFIRQFALVDKNWFDQAPYPKLQRWLEVLLVSRLFVAVMEKHPPWKPGDKPVLL